MHEKLAEAESKCQKKQENKKKSIHTSQFSLASGPGGACLSLLPDTSIQMSKLG
jgi:hypothetical protein